MKNISTKYFVESLNEQFETDNLPEARAMAKILSQQSPAVEIQVVRAKTVFTAKAGVLTEVKNE